MTPGALLLLAAGLLAAGIVTGPRLPRVWLGCVLTGGAAGLAAAVWTLGGGDWEWRSAFAVGGETLHFRLDGLSALFVAWLSVASGAGAAYAREYWSDEHHPDSAARGRAWWSALVLSMGLVWRQSAG